ncbi:MAG: trigger factor [Bifidobacteriaceae bacterium]|nr:trigger factor [Bifidobacteriaceae bacterium]
MKISVRNLEPTKVRLTITVDNDELKPYLDNARTEIAKQVNIPGFRKGHVPGKLVEQRFGFGAIAGDAVQEAVPDFYNKAVQEKDLRPMAQAKLDVKDIPDSEDSDTKLKFTAEVEVRPKFDLPEIEGMEVEVPAAEVSEDDVNARLERMRKSYGTLVSVDRPAKEGDFLSLDISAEIDGETVDSQEGVSYEIGSHNMLDGLDEAVEGLSAGEETTFEGKLEGGDHAGETAQIKVKVNSVKAEELPELNDEFATEASEFDTLDDLKEQLRKDSEDSARARQATEARDAFLAKLQDGLDIPLPKGVLEQVVEQNLSNVTADPKKATKEQKSEAEEQGQKMLRDQILLDTLAEKLDVKVSQNDVINFLASVAQQYGMDPQNFINAVARNGELPGAVQEVARSKGLISAMRSVKFTHEGEVVDLSDFLGEEEEQVNEEAASDEEASVQAAEAAAAVAAKAAQAAEDAEDAKDTE